MLQQCVKGHHVQQQLASVVQARGGAQFLEMRVTMWTAKGVGKRAILDDIEMKQHETAPVHDA